MFQEQEVFAGRFKLLEKIGIGGFSEVWKVADQMAEDAVFALKIYAPEKGLDEYGLKQFRREYALVSGINHPNILTARYFDIYDSHPYLIMPYCSGGSVYDKLKGQGVFSEKELAKFLVQIGGALAHLHKYEIVYQDIKPDNVLIDSEGNYLLMDFGISSSLRSTLTKSTTSTQTMTVAYAPPEKFKGMGELNAASDVFSLGVMMIEMLTDRLPWNGMGGAYLKQNEDIPNLPDGFSADLNNLIKSCLDINPINRPSAAELKNWFSSADARKLHNAKTNQKGNIGRKTIKITDAENDISKKSKLQSKKLNKVIVALLIIVPTLIFGWFVTKTSNSQNGIDLPNSFSKYYLGSVGDISIFMEINKENDSLFGSIFYTKIGVPIVLNGNINEEGSFSIYEILDGNKKVGAFDGAYLNASEIGGIWTKTNSTKTLPFSLEEVPEFPVEVSYEEYHEENCDKGDSIKQIEIEERWRYYDHCTTFDFKLLKVETPSADFSKKINDEIFNRSKSYFSYDEKNKTIEEYLNEVYRIEAFEGFNRKIECDLIARNNFLLSVSIYQSEFFFGSAHGLEYTDYYNVDLRTGKEVTFDDVFISDYKSLLYEEGKKVFESEYDEFYLFNNNFFIDQYAFGSDGIKVLYNRMVLNGYAGGVYRITIPYEDIKPIIKPDGLLGMLW